MPRTRIKFCGITRAQDAEQAAKLGVDALGLIFYQASPRNISIEQAAKIIEKIPPFVSLVGVFVNPTAAEVEKILSQLPIELLQFHGQESAQFCNSFSVPYIKAIGMRAEIKLEQLAEVYATARALLLDSCQPGTGTSFPWELVPKHLSLPIILAGGLNKDNVAQAIELLKPYGVDINSCIETAPGIKDLQKMREVVAVIK